MSLNYSDQDTLNLGNTKAEHELTVLLNLGCPFCRKWYENNKHNLLNNIKNDALNVHLKFWNKDKASLANGNIANDYVDYSDPKKALSYIDEVYAAQKTLDDMDNDKVANFLETELHAKRFVSDKNAQKNNQELLDNGFSSVPTIILDGKVVGDSNYELPSFVK